jgi:ABC-type lipoprotein export system ATPase subunit
MMRRTKQPVIKAVSLFKAFHTPAGGPFLVLKDVGITIQPGEFVIIFGPSGCGKTTLLHTLIGLEEVTKGAVYYSGKKISDLKEEQRSAFRTHNIGIIYQAQYWVKAMNVIQNVGLPILINGGTEAQAYEKAHAALEAIGMSQVASMKPSRLSGGEQQRVGFARAIVNDPDIIVADEPTGNLDSESADRVIALLKHYNRRQKKTIIMVTHNLSYLKHATKIIALRDGQTVNVTDEIKRETKDL